MFISRRLAHKAHERLQLVVGAIAAGKYELATKRAQELSELLAHHTESAEEEQARIKREDED